MKLLTLFSLFVAYAFCAPIETEVGDPPYTHNVTLHIKYDTDKTGQLTLGLFGTIVPKTVANFVQLSTGENGYGYKDSKFHRIIENFMIQGGDIEDANGAGGYSIYGKNFPDENFIVKHDKPGRLSMANAGPNTQGSQFFITTVETAWLDGHHVVFGQLVDGYEFLNTLQKVEGDEKTNKPLNDVIISSIDVKKLEIDSNANADYFDDLRSRNSLKKSGIFWIVIFSGFIVVGLFALKSRRNNLISLKRSIAARAE